MTLNLLTSLLVSSLEVQTLRNKIFYFRFSRGHELWISFQSCLWLWGRCPVFYFYECFMFYISFLQYFLKWVFSLNVYLSNEFKLVIFWNNFGGHRSTDTPVLDFWWGLAGFQKQGRSLAWVLPCLCAMDFSDSPLMQLLRALQPSRFDHILVQTSDFEFLTLVKKSVS